MQETMKVKAYDELEFRDDFMFGKVMQDKELCHDVLECLLQRPVGELEDIQPQREIQYTVDGKPIKLDIYTRDDNAVYDAEMQNLNKKSTSSLELPRRTRFYQASIDMDHMNKSQSYRTLPDSTILFICTFDPFGKGLAQYTIRGRCDENTEITIDDGAERILYNCCYEGEDIPEELRKLYDYIETGKSSSDLTERIDNAVEEAKKIEEWRSGYMKEMALFMEAKEEGREEGREEEKKNTEKERKRANAAEAKVKELEAKIAAIQVV